MQTGTRIDSIYGEKSVSSRTSKAQISLLTAVVTAVITATITVGIPELVKAVQPDETIHVVLQDLREKDPEEFDQYIETEFQKNNQVVMERAEGGLSFGDDALSCYTLGEEDYISVSELVRASGGMLQITGDGSLSAGTDLRASGETSSNWLEACPPYDLGAFTTVLEADGGTFQVGGIAYSEGLFSEPVWQSQALFNLQGNYKALTFSAGHIDETDLHDCTHNF